MYLFLLISMYVHFLVVSLVFCFCFADRTAGKLTLDAQFLYKHLRHTDGFDNNKKHKGKKQQQASQTAEWTNMVCDLKGLHIITVI